MDLTIQKPPDELPNRPPDLAVPAISLTDQLAVEKEIHGDTTIPEVSLRAPIADKELLEQAPDDVVGQQSNMLQLRVGVAFVVLISVSVLYAAYLWFRSQAIVPVSP